MPMPLYNHLKEHRARLGLNQQQLGSLVGASRQTISLIERGDYSPSVTLALKIYPQSLSWYRWRPVPSRYSGCRPLQRQPLQWVRIHWKGLQQLFGTEKWAGDKAAGQRSVFRASLYAVSYNDTRRKQWLLPGQAPRQKPQRFSTAGSALGRRPDSENFILGDTSNYQLLKDIDRYSYDHGTVYFSPVSLKAELILGEEQLAHGWDTDYLGMYRFVEHYRWKLVKMTNIFVINTVYWWQGKLSREK